jgi:hypothetical protein
VWQNEWRCIKLESPVPECPTCGLGRYETLEAEAGEVAVSLCGRDAVQVRPAAVTQVDLPALAERLRAAGEVQLNPYLLRLRAGDYELTVFKDARAIIRGTDDVPTARSLYARYVGN